MRTISANKWREWVGYTAFAVVVACFVCSCGGLKKLAQNDRRVDIHLPAKVKQDLAVPVDAVTAPQVISFKKQDGSEVFFAATTIDSASGEKMMSVAIDEVVISAGSRRNLVERNGKINIDYVVTVPKTLLNQSWQLVIDPRLRKGEDTLSLAPLVYRGTKFSDMQEREYARYEAYLGQIVDSANLYDRFGNKKQFNRHMNYVATEHAKFVAVGERLDRLSPDAASYDKVVGWMTVGDRRRQTSALRGYINDADGNVRRNAYVPASGGKFDHLEDYFRPRYRYGDVQVIPGGEIYTRVEGEYPDLLDRRRESYIRAVGADASGVRRQVRHATRKELPELVEERLAYTGLERPNMERLIRDMSDSTMAANHLIRRQYAAERVALLEQVDTNAVRASVLDRAALRQNQALIDNSDAAYSRLVQHPYFAHARLDTLIYRPDGKIDYYCSDEVTADENTSKLYLFLAGDVENTSGRTCSINKSDTLTYNVASMTTFLDETPRYMQRIVVRDAEANARFFFTFPSAKSDLDESLPENQKQIAAVRNLTRNLMIDPIYIIDSITLRATASPEGSWAKNTQLARERAEVLRRVLTGEFRSLYDSLRIGATVSLNERGEQVVVTKDQSLPDLPHLLRTQSLAEDWDQLRRLIEQDSVIRDKQGIYELITSIENPDTREWTIRGRYPAAYDRMRKVLYPQMRAVDFRFNLHRRGMQQDTVYTTEIDTAYMRAVELLKKRRYEPALEILRPYEDRNTALAYMSLGYDAAAYRILRGLPATPDTADLQYMLAILASRLNEEEQSVKYFLRSVELKPSLKFRGNLDPEVARLIRKYGLFKEDFE